MSGDGGPRWSPLAVWAAREVQREAGRSCLLFAFLFLLVAIIATPMLFSHALAVTWTRWMEQTPHLVVRRIDAGGWAPLPAEAAVHYARKVPGALDPTPRLWGVATGPAGPVTVVTAPADLPAEGLPGQRPPAPGEAVVGRAVADAAVDNHLVLEQMDRVTLAIVATFPDNSVMVTHDLVWVAPPDARRLLGMLPDQASDLAVRLFRSESASAVAADLAAAFPWPVRIIDRDTMTEGLRRRAMGKGVAALMLSLPALLAFLWVMTGAVTGPAGRSAYWGVLSAMGWTTADLVRLQVAKALLVGMPALAVGLAVACGAVFHPMAAAWTAFLLMGTQQLPALALDGSGAVVMLLQIAAVVGLPFLAAVFLTTLRGVEGAARSTMEAGQWH
ncbi:hypothetical protein [Desulfatitalea alkaliphila]|uniref:Uncharacterized protein n=1 Tax=Desulfatitalea alkaliphila TaxID=2929485 RepID=A0AA41R5M2_9BACT|nr:hypothetical protein [Desulfatitalea alkaliphila]MCJ8502236.1 hypothetical protein [Desulfatitalea alkaliphila]